ncbi:unnamed protein product [Allacma fusca]|uniref:JNK1/MAPK8-associated membrane protein n=1 Tax=Allacma fusca TaxID=39272 RepID=A0A8J2MCK8_9HEXA|nr:unnamed protein product [Allacma fusca]
MQYEHARGNVSKLPAYCPGLYCGRRVLQEGNIWGACGSCPRGFRRNDQNYVCTPCQSDLLLYDWLYLGFMALLPVLLHLSSIETKLLRSGKHTLGLVVCSVVEVALAGVITLLSWEPASRMSDWYPIFYNPQPNFMETLHCSYEAVYPLYTIVLVFYAVADLLMLIMRFLAHVILGVKVSKSIYAGLYFFPILALAHLTLGGLIYNYFPYVTIITSVISCSYNFSKRKNQDIRSLFLDSVKDWRNLGIILCHWFLHGYGIISITELKNFYRDLWLLSLVPLPALLYIFTVNFSDPAKVLAN